MSLLKTFIHGDEGIFKGDTLTQLQKMVLRFVVVGLVYYGIVVIEGMLMRIYEVTPVSFISQPQFFAIMTAHPLVGIFGSTYSIVFGAFLFVVPFMMKKPLWSMKLANWNFILVTAGTLLLIGFLAFFFNIVMSIVIKGVIEIFMPAKNRSASLLPE